MASTSAARATDAVAGRIKNAANTLSSDNQSLIADIRRTVNSMQEIAVEMEKSHLTDQVKELENAVVQLLSASDECQCFSNVIQSVGNNYQPGEELSNFGKLLKDEKSKRKGNSSSNHQNDSLLRRFREAVWKVHHAGQPMPGEEHEDIVMTTTEVGLLNTVCPITGKSVTELLEPVRSMDCKHVYEKEAIIHHMKNHTKSRQCPVAGCPKQLVANRVVCDPLLPVEIDEMRALNKQTDMADHLEDFTSGDRED